MLARVLAAGVCSGSGMLIRGDLMDLEELSAYRKAGPPDGAPVADAMGARSWCWRSWRSSSNAIIVIKGTTTTACNA